MITGKMGWFGRRPLVVVSMLAVAAVEVGTAQAQPGAVDGSRWVAIRPVPRATSPAVATIAGDGRIFVMGESGTQVDVYSPTSDSWSTVAPYPAQTLNAPALASVRGHVYVVGGEQQFQGRTNLVYEYDQASNRWQPRASMPARLSAPAGVVAVRGRIYVVGGTLRSGAFNRVVYRYDPETDRWATATRLPRQLVDHTNPVFAIGRRIYVVAWPRRPFVLNQDVFAFDTATGVWRREPPYRLGRRLALPSIAVVHRRAWIVGGFAQTATTETITRSVRVYDPRTGRLHLAQRLPEPTVGAAVVYDRREHALYAFAGVTSVDDSLTVTDHAYKLLLPAGRSGGG